MKYIIQKIIKYSSINTIYVSSIVYLELNLKNVNYSHKEQIFYFLF